jgi:hypothetical protein
MIPTSIFLLCGTTFECLAQNSARGRASYASRLGRPDADQDGLRHVPADLYPGRPVPPGLTDSFFRGVIDLSTRLNCDPRDLLAVLMRESSLRPDAWNRSSNAVGLAQFLPSTLNRLGWTGTADQFRALSAEEQLPYVERFLLPSSSYGLYSAGRIYQAIFMPASLRTAASDDAAIIDKRGAFADRYQRNRGLDLDGDGRITVGELQQSIEIVFRSPKWRPIEDRLRLLERDGRSSGSEARPAGEPEDIAEGGIKRRSGGVGRAHGSRVPEDVGESTIAPRATHVRDSVAPRPPSPPQRPASGASPLGIGRVAPGRARHFEDWVRTIDLRTKQGMKEGLAILGFRSSSRNHWSALRAFQNSIGLRGAGFAGGKTLASLSLALSDAGVRSLW